jgi:regulatory protein
LPRKVPVEAALSRAGLEAAALDYLNRFDCSVQKLRGVLEERVRRALLSGATDDANASGLIEEILARYQESGLLNDLRFAQKFAEQQRARGQSRRAIEAKLSARGVSAELVAKVLGANQSGADEISAAEAYARRRRIGPYRKPEERPLRREQDLAALARAGFDWDTARRVIGHAAADDDF